MLQRLLYVSASRLPPETALAEVDGIIVRARLSNPRRGITGGLVYTRGHFAQVLEGELSELEALMSRIKADPRHERVNVVTQSAIRERLFSAWSMAYAGESLFMDKQVSLLLEDANSLSEQEQKLAAQRLLSFVRQFVEIKSAKSEGRATASALH